MPLIGLLLLLFVNVSCHRGEVVSEFGSLGPYNFSPNKDCSLGGKLGSQCASSDIALVGTRKVRSGVSPCSEFGVGDKGEIICTQCNANMLYEADGAGGCKQFKSAKEYKCTSYETYRKNYCKVENKTTGMCDATIHEEICVPGLVSCDVWVEYAGKKIGGALSGLYNAGTKCTENLEDIADFDPNMKFEKRPSYLDFCKAAAESSRAAGQDVACECLVEKSGLCESCAPGYYPNLNDSHNGCSKIVSNCNTELVDGNKESKDLTDSQGLCPKGKCVAGFKSHLGFCLPETCRKWTEIPKVPASSKICIPEHCAQYNTFGFAPDCIKCESTYFPTAEGTCGLTSQAYNSPIGCTAWNASTSRCLDKQYCTLASAAGYCLDSCSGVPAAVTAAKAALAAGTTKLSVIQQLIDNKSIFADQTCKSEWRIGAVITIPACSTPDTSGSYCLDGTAVAEVIDDKISFAIDTLSAVDYTDYTKKAVCTADKTQGFEQRMQFMYELYAPYLPVDEDWLTKPKKTMYAAECADGNGFVANTRRCISLDQPSYKGKTFCKRMDPQGNCTDGFEQQFGEVPDKYLGRKYEPDGGKESLALKDFTKDAHFPDYPQPEPGPLGEQSVFAYASQQKGWYCDNTETDEIVISKKVTVSTDDVDEAGDFTISGDKSAPGFYTSGGVVGDESPYNGDRNLGPAAGTSQYVDQNIPYLTKTRAPQIYFSITACGTADTTWTNCTAEGSRNIDVAARDRRISQVCGRTTQFVPYGKKSGIVCLQGAYYDYSNCDSDKAYPHTPFIHDSDGGAQIKQPTRSRNADGNWMYTYWNTLPVKDELAPGVCTKPKFISAAKSGEKDGSFQCQLPVEANLPCSSCAEGTCHGPAGGCTFAGAARDQHKAICSGAIACAESLAACQVDCDIEQLVYELWGQTFNYGTCLAPCFENSDRCVKARGVEGLLGLGSNTTQDYKITDGTQTKKMSSLPTLSVPSMSELYAVCPTLEKIVKSGELRPKSEFKFPPDSNENPMLQKTLVDWQKSFASYPSGDGASEKPPAMPLEVCNTVSAVADSEMKIPVSDMTTSCSGSSDCVTNCCVSGKCATWNAWEGSWATDCEQ